MDDSAGQGRGGRLVMLGTPNRGSFAIPLTLTGGEKLVKVLAKADFSHSLDELLSILGTFPGLYDMLPSPLVDLDDDHEQLFDVQAWGKLHVSADRLSAAQKLIRDLDEVIDPKRLLYVAGFNQRTPARIRVDRPGEFSYLETADGDGRVLHVLGLLDGVTTYWVDEIHGNLAKNASVLDAITELLQTRRDIPASLSQAGGPRAPARGLRRGWVSGDDIEPVEPEIDTILTRSHARRAAAEPAVAPEDAIRVEELGFGSTWARPSARTRGGEPKGARPPRPSRAGLPRRFGSRSSGAT